MTQRHAFDLCQTLFSRWIPNHNAALEILLGVFGKATQNYGIAPNLNIETLLWRILAQISVYSMCV